MIAVFLTYTFLQTNHSRTYTLTKQIETGWHKKVMTSHKVPSVAPHVTNSQSKKLFEFLGNKKPRILNFIHFKQFIVSKRYQRILKTLCHCWYQFLRQDKFDYIPIFLSKKCILLCIFIYTKSILWNQGSYPGKIMATSTCGHFFTGN